MSVKIKLFTRKKNDYHLLLPISNEAGLIEVTKKWLEIEIEKERNFAASDFTSNLADCELNFDLKILDNNELNNSLNSSKLYQLAFRISDEEILKLNQVDNKLYYATSKSVILDGNPIEEIILATTKK